MPPKRSKAFKLAKASALDRTTTRLEGDSVDVSLEVTPFVSVQRRLYPPTSGSPTTPVSPTTPTTDVTHPDTEASTSTSGPPALDIRINSRRTRIHVEPTEESVTKKARRGIITGKAIKRDIANNENKRLPLKWSMDKELPDTNNVIRIAKQIGSIVREHIPMLTEYYYDLKEDDYKIVVDQLSVFFEIDLDGPPGEALFEWIHATARHAYNRWRTDCHALYKHQGRLPIPKNFVHRSNQWDFLCTIFEEETWKNKSKRMSETRLSKNWVEHKSGPILFKVRANKLEANGHVAPYLGTIAETTKSEDRKKLVEEAIEKIKNDSDNTLDSTVLPMRCPIEKEISIIEKIVGPSVGTVVRGMGCLAVRAPRMRGPTKGTFMPVDDLRRKLAERDEEIRLLKEAQDEAKKEAAEQKKEAAEQKNMILTLMQICGVGSDANSNATTSTSKALG